MSKNWGIFASVKQAQTLLNMTNKTDLARIQSYSVALAEKLCQEYFQSNNSVDGPAILKFTPIEQVNLFVIKNLFDKWKEESLKLRSPYFNYEEPEVKEALTNFLNKLSRHIAIRKEFFKPLLQKSLSDALTYLLTPYDFITREYLNESSISLSSVRERERYIRLHKGLMRSFLDKLESLSPDEQAGSELQKMFKVIHDQYAPDEDEIQTVISMFSSMLPVTINEFTRQETKPVEAFVTKPVIQPSLFNDTTESSIYQKFQQPSSMGNSFRNEEPTLAEKLRRSRVQDLKSSIPLNLKFLFINELFDSQSEDYNKALMQLDMYDSLDSAQQFIKGDLAIRYKWDMNKAEVKDFIEIVERRYN